ncbi:hypothetical protein BKA70DRAFT_1227275 [Coprinopsis sp. MPI-PUGE-AT-0042]|nr:hypothetical protein BKA70DRAFT_1227275 [Coprinopsis sp. MPI-PUGE-AT-0042]
MSTLAHTHSVDLLHLPPPINSPFLFIPSPLSYIRETLAASLVAASANKIPQAIKRDESELLETLPGVGNYFPSNLKPKSGDLRPGTRFRLGAASSEATTFSIRAHQPLRLVPYETPAVHLKARTQQYNWYSPGQISNPRTNAEERSWESAARSATTKWCQSAWAFMAHARFFLKPPGAPCFRGQSCESRMRRPETQMSQYRARLSKVPVDWIRTACVMDVAIFGRIGSHASGTLCLLTISNCWNNRIGIASAGEASIPKLGVGGTLNPSANFKLRLPSMPGCRGAKMGKVGLSSIIDPIVVDKYFIVAVDAASLM